MPLGIREEALRWGFTGFLTRPLPSIRVVPQITAVCDPVFLDIRAVRLGLAAVEHVFEKTPPARRKVESVLPSLERFCRLPSGTCLARKCPQACAGGSRKMASGHPLRFRGELLSIT